MTSKVKSRAFHIFPHKTGIFLLVNVPVSGEFGVIYVTAPTNFGDFTSVILLLVRSDDQWAQAIILYKVNE